jgi:hypothetical protein
MDKISWGALAVVGFLLLGVFIAGCSDNVAPAADVTVAPTQSNILYSAGDIVKNPASSSNVALLIIGYDPATDMYERAYIYPSSDGSFGYRLDSKTDPISRSVIENVYSEKVRTIEVSAVPIGTPAVATTTAAASATTVTTATTTATATTTTATGPAPRIKSIEPDKGKTGTTVSITNLEGDNFRSGANVTFKKYGEPAITMTDIDVSSGLISGKLVIPSDTEIGFWDVIVTNSDGQYHQYQNGFLIQLGTTTSTTTTTTTASPDSPTITDIDPEFTGAGGYIPITIFGTKFLNGITAKLTKSYKPDIVSSTCSRQSEMEMKCFFEIPAGSQGTWNVVVTNTDGHTATLANAFSVNS